jgi:hypothetical protein
MIDKVLKIPDKDNNSRPERTPETKVQIQELRSLCLSHLFLLKE